MTSHTNIPADHTFMSGPSRGRPSFHTLCSSVRDVSKFILTQRRLEDISHSRRLPKLTLAVDKKTSTVLLVFYNYVPRKFRLPSKFAILFQVPSKS